MKIKKMRPYVAVDWQISGVPCVGVPDRGNHRESE